MVKELGQKTLEVRTSSRKELADSVNKLLIEIVANSAINLTREGE